MGTIHNGTESQRELGQSAEREERWVTTELEVHEDREPGGESEE